MATAKKVSKYDSFHEWKASNTAKRLADAVERDEGRAALKALYESLDADGDGKLTAEEWAHGLTANAEVLAKWFGDETVADDHLEAFAALDEDGNGSLSWDEFLAGASKIKPVLSDPVAYASSSGTNEGGGNGATATADPPPVVGAAGSPPA